MLNSQKLKIEMSKSRERLAVLSGKEDLTEAEQNEIRELTDAYPAIEERYRGALISEDVTDEKDVTETAPDGESKELFDLASRASVGRYLERAASGRSLDGVEAELNAGLGLPGGDRMPVSLLLPQDENGFEDRADSATTLNINTAQRPQAWLPRVFEGTATQHLGIARKSVSGLAAFPIIGSGVTAQTVTKGTAKDAEALGLSVETLDPKRISARYLFSREDAARLGPAVFEDALRNDMRFSLASQMDDELINGVDDSSNATVIEGLLEAVTAKQIDGSADGAITDGSTGKEIADGVLSQIDGKYAQVSGDLRYIANPALFSHMKTLGLEIGQTAGDKTNVPLESWLAAEGVKGMAAGHLGEITGQSRGVLRDHFPRPWSCRGRLSCGLGQRVKLSVTHIPMSRPARLP